MTASHACKLGNFHVHVSATTGYYDSVGVIVYKVEYTLQRSDLKNTSVFSFVTELFAALFSQTSVMI